MQGDLPAEFKRLQQETKQLLKNSSIQQKYCFEFRSFGERRHGQY
jgi:hypothetical protein